MARGPATHFCSVQRPGRNPAAQKHASLFRVPAKHRTTSSDADNRTCNIPWWAEHAHVKALPRSQHLAGLQADSRLDVNRRDHAKQDEAFPTFTDPAITQSPVQLNRAGVMAPSQGLRLHQTVEIRRFQASYSCVFNVQFFCLHGVGKTVC